MNKACEFCGSSNAKNIYYQKMACDKCMAERSAGEATVITRFPGQDVQQYLDKHGKLPE